MGDGRLTKQKFRQIAEMFADAEDPSRFAGLDFPLDFPAFYGAVDPKTCIMAVLDQSKVGNDVVVEEMFKKMDDVVVEEMFKKMVHKCGTKNADATVLFNSVR